MDTADTRHSTEWVQSIQIEAEGRLAVERKPPTQDVTRLAACCQVPVRPVGRLWLQLVIAGVLGYPISAGLLYWGLTEVAPTTSAFISNLSPFIVIALGFYALREAPSATQWLGFAKDRGEARR